MAIEQSRTPIAFARPLDVVRLFAIAVRAFAGNMMRRREVIRLSEAPDYLLKDIGLKRDDIHSALSADWREDPTYRLALRALRNRREGGR